MIPTRRFFVMAGLGLLVGCNYPSVSQPTDRRGLAGLLESVIRPPTLVALSAGAYWAKEGQWPSSVSAIAGSLPVDDEWRDAAAALSNVSFVPQADGSLRVSAVCLPLRLSTNTEIRPVHVEVIVRVRKDPQSPSGYAVSVDPGAPKT